MKIAICVKQVPDTEARLKVRADGRWIEEEDLPFVINESDTFALEEALRIAGEQGGEVIVFGLGPARIQEALRKALAMGANRAVHLEDEAFSGGDAMTTGKALAAAIRHQECDLVITGSQSDDESWGATGTVVAGELGWPHAWLLMGVKIEDDTVEVTREMEGGINEISRLALPAVLEVQAGINHPRYASLRGIMQAKRKPIDKFSPADLGLDPNELGEKGARVQVVSVAFPVSGEGAEMIEGDATTVASSLVDKLQKEARVL